MNIELSLTADLWMVVIEDFILSRTPTSNSNDTHHIAENGFKYDTETMISNILLTRCLYLSQK